MNSDPHLPPIPPIESGEPATPATPMEDPALAQQRSLLASGCLAAAVILGLLGDGLLRVTPWGINATLWVCGVLVAAAALVRWRRLELAGEGRWLVVPIVFFAAAIAWRDSPILGIINVLALLICLALAAYRTLQGSLLLASLLQYAWAHVLAVGDAVSGLLLLVFKDIRWKDPANQGRPVAWPSVIRGAIIVLPLLLLFGGLFMAADPVFERAVRDLFRWDLWEAINHLLLILVFSCLVAGFLRRLLMAPDQTKLVGECPSRVALGSIEVTVILSALDALFLSFVIIQFRYLFGGAEVVKASIGMGYSEYTRRGFFELATVAALVLITLLVGDWWRRKGNGAGDRLFQGLAGLLVALVFVVMVSAIQRMRLNVDEQGLSELRIYVTVFIGWMAVMLLWFAATALRGQRERFVAGALATGLLAAALLNAINPDAMIARDNLERIQRSQNTDPGVIRRLSADGVVAACQPVAGLDRAAQDAAIQPAVKRWRTRPVTDWRSWNWSRSQAMEAAATCAPDAGPKALETRGRNP